MNRKPIHRIVLLGAIVALATLTSVSSGAITPGEPFAIAPGEGAPFTTVSASGANCVGRDAGAELEDLSGDELPGGTGTIPGAFVGFFALPDGSGNWSGTFTIPPIVETGEYRVVARCGTDAYAPQPFTVLAGELASLSVSPVQGTAGTELPVTVSGTLCRGTDPGVDVGIFDAALEGTEEFVVRVSVTPDAAGNWTTLLTIPAGTPAGIYRIGVQCLLGGDQFFLYLPPPTIVLNVVSRPSFTG